MSFFPLFLFLSSLADASGYRGVALNYLHTEEVVLERVFLTKRFFLARGITGSGRRSVDGDSEAG